MDRLRWLTLGIAALPLACGCVSCPTTLLCFGAAALAAGAAFYAASLLRELWLLRLRRDR
ncbi:MAG: hypothetical protein KGJ44_12225 [Betaproteobacteria bacterium]|nr:hypothetical protein [Betaproteobacteria bacterium]MDE2049172.1 hypothetical protein [Betaproteobacteria bacterium]